MTTRVATAAANSMYISNMLRTNSRMYDYQMQVNTEQKSQTYAGLGNTSFRLVNLETQRDEAEHYIDTNTTLELRLNMMQTSLEALSETVQQFRSKLEIFAQNNADNATNEDAVDDIQRWAFQAMQDMQDYLNTRVDGQYIFAGGKTQTEPVDLNLTTLTAFQTTYTGNPPNDYPDTRAEQIDPTTGYYRGDDQKLTYRVDTDREIEMGVNATDPAFEKAIRAMGLIAQGAFDTAYDPDVGVGSATNPGALNVGTNLEDRVEQALWLLEDALAANATSRTSPFGVTEDSSDFESVGRVTGFNQVVVNETVTVQKTYIGFLNVQIDKMEKADVTGAIVHMQDEQRALEASYHTISLMQGLNLVDYLR